MSKLRTDVGVAFAGAGSGVFSASVFLLAERVNTYYDYIKPFEERIYESRYDQGVEDLWWIPLVFWHVVLSIGAALLMHRYLATDRVSPFLRWQAISIVTLFGWGLSLFTIISMECLMNGSTRPGGRLLTISIAHFISTVFASNVLFGSAIQAASSGDP